ncbi:hypothetical protein NL676_035630 [Syzygium grande]|nr:hypothetical protein NL676_035630 [Syzygium grande]
MEWLDRIDWAVAKARRDLHLARVSVSSWKVSQAAVLALQVESWSSLGFSMQQVPSLQRLMALEGKESNPMATQPGEEQGNLDHAEQPAEISEEQVGGRYYRPLLQATFESDWESAKRFLEQDSASKTATITSRSETVLHIATFSAHDQFFENLVEILSPHPEALEMVDCDGRTAHHIAVLCGRIRMVKALDKRNPKLTQLPDKEGRVPLGTSALEASMHKEITWFLVKNTTDDGPNHPLSSPDAIETIIDRTYAGHHDITVYLVRPYPHFMTMKGSKRKGHSILFALALMESHFLSGTRLNVMEALIYKCPYFLHSHPFITDSLQNDHHLAHHLLFCI